MVFALPVFSSYWFIYPSMKYDELHDWINTHCCLFKHALILAFHRSRYVCNSLVLLLYNKCGIIQASVKYLRTLDLSIYNSNLPFYRRPRHLSIATVLFISNKIWSNSVFTFTLRSTNKFYRINEKFWINNVKMNYLQKTNKNIYRLKIN